MCSSTPPAEVELPLDGESARVARHFVRDRCCPHVSSALDEAELLVSELVTNAVRHGLPPVVLRLSCDDGRALDVRIRDSSDQAPVPRQASADDESGRGMGLLDVISSAWGVEPSHDGEGKVVWFRLTP